MPEQSRGAPSLFGTQAIVRSPYAMAPPQNPKLITLHGGTGPSSERYRSRAGISTMYAPAGPAQSEIPSRYQRQTWVTVDQRDDFTRWGRGAEGMEKPPEKLRIMSSLKQIVRQDGYRALYRGVGINMVGNGASWGFYFLWYSMIKERMYASQSQEESVRLSAGQHLLASASSGVITACLTNPLWVVKTRMLATRSSSQGAYTGIINGLMRVAREEGLPGLYRGTFLAIIGVSSGAIQFMTYEELKKWRRDVARRKTGAGPSNGPGDDLSLSNTEYILLSGASKLLAIGITYPYQVVRARIQNQSSVIPSQPNPNPTQVHYRSIPHLISHTYKNEGFLAFYKGLAPNAVRVLPGTCVTFVVYENLSAWIGKVAKRRSGESKGTAITE